MIVLQHAEAELLQLTGLVCNALLAVQNGRTGSVEACYLQIAGIWHQAVVQNGILYWEEGEAPFPDNDLLNDGTYVDIAAHEDLAGQLISHIHMHQNVLSVGFVNRRTQTFTYLPADDFVKHEST